MENLDTRVAESLASGKKIIDEVAYDLLAKEIIALIQTKAESSHTHSADQVTETDSKKFVSPQEKKTWNDKVSQEQLTAAINTFASGLAWKYVAIVAPNSCSICAMVIGVCLKIPNIFFSKGYLGTP